MKYQLVKTIWSPQYLPGVHHTECLSAFVVNSLLVDGMVSGYSELLSFTASKPWASIGFRIPAIFIGGDGRIGIGTQIGAEGNAWAMYPLAEKTWYHLELSQFSEDKKVKIS